MATIKNDNDIVLQASTARVTDTVANVSLDISGFTGFNVDADGIFTPTTATLSVLNGVDAATYIWTVEGASRIPSYTDSIIITPLATSSHVNCTVTEITPGFTPIKVSVYGDSLSAGQPVSVLPDVTFPEGVPSTAFNITLVSNGLFNTTNYALGGTNTDMAKNGTSPFTSPYISFANQMSTRDTADYVLIRYGINDSSTEPGVGVSAVNFRANLNEFISQARIAGKTPILVNIINIPTNGTVPQWRVDQVNAFNDIIENVALLASVTLIDLKRAVLNYTATSVSPDGIHPTKEANLEIDEILTQLLAKAIAPTYTLHKTVTMPIVTNGPAGVATFLVERPTDTTALPAIAPPPTNDEVKAVISRNPIVGDLVTLSYDDRKLAVTYKCTVAPNADAVPPVVEEWVTVANYIPGSLIVSDTITVDKLKSSTTTLTDMTFSLGQKALATPGVSIYNFDTAGAFSTTNAVKFALLAANTGSNGVAFVGAAKGSTSSAILSIGNWDETTGAFKHSAITGYGDAAGIFRGKTSATTGTVFPTDFSTGINLATSSYAIELTKGDVYSGYDFGINIGTSKFNFKSTGISPDVNNTLSNGETTKRWSNIYSTLGNFSGIITWGGYPIPVPTGVTTTFLRNDGTWVAPSISTASSNLSPISNNTYSLGTSVLRWSNLYSVLANISGDITWNGKVIAAPTGSTTTYLNNNGTWTTPATNPGTVTSVTGTGTVSGLTLSGTGSSSVTLTLGGAITGFAPTVHNHTLDNVVSAGSNSTINASFNGTYIGRFGTPTLVPGITTTIGTNIGIAHISGAVQLNANAWTGAGDASESLGSSGANWNELYLKNSFIWNGKTITAPTAVIGSGTTYLRNDGTWVTPSFSGSVSTLTPIADNTYTSGTVASKWANTYSVLANISSNLTLGGDLVWNGITIPKPTGTTTTFLSNAGTWITPAGAGIGTVTSVSGTGSINGITLSGTVTSSGNITLGGSVTLASLSLSTGVHLTDSAIQFGTGNTSTKIVNNGANLELCSTISVAPTVGIGPVSTGNRYCGTSLYRWADVYSVLGNFSGTVTTANLNWGGYPILAPAGLTTYLRNDGIWANPPGNISSLSVSTPLSSSGGSSPTISIPAATSIANGYMTSTYAAKLDGIAAGATANLGTVTSVSGSSSVSGLTLTSTGTSSINLALGGAITGFAPTVHYHTLDDVVSAGSNSTINASFKGVNIGTFSTIPSITTTGTLIGIANSTNAVGLDAGVFRAAGDATESLGDTSHRWNELYLKNSLIWNGKTIAAPTATVGSGTTYLRNDGTWVTPATNPGTVTSVSGTGTVSGLTLSGSVTSAGTLTLGGAITGFAPTVHYHTLDDVVSAGSNSTINASFKGVNIGTFSTIPSITTTGTLIGIANSTNAVGLDAGVFRAAGDATESLGDTSHRWNELYLKNSFIWNGKTIAAPTAVVGSGTTYLRNDGTWVTPATNPGTVTSVSGTGTVSGLTLSGSVTSAGTLTLGGAITGFAPTVHNHTLDSVVTTGSTSSINATFNGVNIGTFSTVPSITTTGALISIANSTNAVGLASSVFRAAGDATESLGDTSHRWNELYLKNSLIWNGKTIAAPTAVVGSGTTYLRNDGTWVTPTDTVGVTSVSAGSGLNGGTITSSGTVAIDYTSDGTWSNGLTIGASTYIKSSGDVGFTSAGVSFGFTSAGLAPINDGTKYLGGPSNRWNTVFATTGTINTSDERLKEQVSDALAPELRAWAKVNFVKYKFKDMVVDKGTGARWHFGVIAQQVKEAFESEGLNPFEYGILCYDEWDAAEAEYSNDVEVKPAKSAGNRYGIRYEEALILECAYLRSKL